MQYLEAWGIEPILHKGLDLKPVSTLPVDVYLRQNLDMNNMLALMTINLRQGILNEREYRISREAFFSSLNVNDRQGCIPTEVTL